MRLLFGARAKTICSLRIVPRSKLLFLSFSRFASSSSNKQAKRNINEEKEPSSSFKVDGKSSKKETGGWKQLPGVHNDEGDVSSSSSAAASFSPRRRTQKKTDISSSTIPSIFPSSLPASPSSLPASPSEASSPSSVNIWNEPVIDRRKHKTLISSVTNDKELAGRIKTKITQAQTRMCNPTSPNIPPPSSLRSLLTSPEQILPSSPSSSRTSVPTSFVMNSGTTNAQLQQEHLQAQQTTHMQQTQQLQTQQQQQAPSQQPTQGSYRAAVISAQQETPSSASLRKNLTDKNINKEKNKIEEEEENSEDTKGKAKQKQPPRRVRPSVRQLQEAEEEIFPPSLLVPRLECLSHTYQGSATRKSEWPEKKNTILASLPQVCFVGKTNSGKSSLLNQFFKGRRLAKASSRPGVTTSLDFYSIDEKVMFVDTPGYGKNLNKQARNKWEAMVKEYLKHSPSLRLVCLLLDITNLPSEDDLSILRLVQTRCGRQKTTSMLSSTYSPSSLSSLSQEQEQNVSSSSAISSSSFEQSQQSQHAEQQNLSLEDIAQTTNATAAEEVNTTISEQKEEAAKDHPIPVLLVLTKDDHVTHDQRSNLVHRIKRRLQWSGPFLCYSIKDRRGRGKLLRHIMTTLFQPESSLLLKDMLRPDFVPYGSIEHRGLVKKDNRETHWQIQQRKEVEAQRAGSKIDNKKRKARPSQEGPVKLTEVSF